MNIVSLKEYLDRLFEAHAREHELLQKAIEKTETALEKRLEGMNEFRSQLKEQAGQFITRDTRDADKEVLLTELRRVETNLSMRLTPLEEFQKSFYVKVVSIGTAFTLINIGIALINYLGLGK